MNTETRWAYCHACGDAVDCNEDGCIECSKRTKRRSRLARIALAGLFFWAGLVRDGKAMAS